MAGIFLILLNFHWTELLQPQWYIENGGLWFVLFAVFAETGLFAGFFLPGDSLLFVCGFYAHEMTVNGVTKPGLAYQFLDKIGLGQMHNVWVDLLLLITLISLAGILGNLVGYWFGRKSGPFLFERKDTFFFRKKYLFQARDFYEKHGGGAIIIARFIPILRTFAPIVAGVVGMEKRKFAYFNIIGCVAWVSAMVFAGYFLQQLFWKVFHFDLKEHLEVIVLVIVLITTAPLLIKVFAKKKVIKITPDDGNA